MKDYVEIRISQRGEEVTEELEGTPTDICYRLMRAYRKVILNVDTDTQFFMILAAEILVDAMKHEVLEELEE